MTSSNLQRCTRWLTAACFASVSMGCMTTNVYVSDEPCAAGEGSEGPAFATESGNVSAGTVLASDYTINFDAFVMEKDVNGVVQSVSGYAQLTDVSVNGQDYVIYDGALTGASSIAEVEAAYGAATTGLLSSLTTLELPATGFGLVGLNLETASERTVIIRNSDHGVSAYQLILVAFRR